MKRRWELCAVAVMLAAAVWLVHAQVMVAVDGGLDQELYVRLASHVAAGQWLGPFDNRTLARGAGYPMFIALAYWLHVPLKYAQLALHAAACLLAWVAFRGLGLSSLLRLALFAALLLNPETWTHVHVMREAIYCALVTAIVACLIGYHVTHCRVRWGAALGLFVAAAWLTREESQWLLPLVLPLWALSAVGADGSPRRRVLARLLPVAAFFAAVWSVCLANFINYRVFTTAEFRRSEFVAAYGALSRVTPLEPRRYAVLRRETRARLYPLSPSFARLAPALEGGIGRGWAYSGHAALHLTDEEGDILGAWFLWALRDAVAEEGLYRDAPTALGFYRTLAREVNDACDSGRIRCGPASNSLAPPWRSGYALLGWRSFWKLADLTVFFPRHLGGMTFSHGGPATQRRFAKLLREPVAPTAEQDPDFVNRYQRTPQARVDRALRWLYLVAVPPLLLLAFAGWLMRSYELYRRRRIEYAWALGAAIAAAAILRLGLLAYIDVTTFYAGEMRLLSPMLPLLFLFCGSQAPREVSASPS